MSTSSAFPVLRTADLRTAYEAAQDLLRLVIPMDRFRVSAEAQVVALAEAQRMATAFSTAVVAPDDPHLPESNDEVRSIITRGDARAGAMLPVTVLIEDQPVGSIEERFFSVIGTGPASIDWSWFSWPAVPELGLEARGKDDYLQIAINCRDVHRDIPATDHTVFIHVRGWDSERAEWLARQVGLQLIGPPELGF